VSVAEQSIVELENQLCITVDSAERHQLLQSLIKEVVRFEKDAEFAAKIERRIAQNNERFKRQKELVAQLKRDGLDTRDAYFLLVTLKTISALFGYHRALARKILVCVVPRKG